MGGRCDRAFNSEGRPLKAKNLISIGSTMSEECEFEGRIIQDLMIEKFLLEALFHPEFEWILLVQSSLSI